MNTTNGGPPSSPPDVPSRSFTEMLEIIIYTVCLCVGGPLNIVSFYRLFRQFRGMTKSAATAMRSSAQIILLRLNLNIADLLTMFVYTTSQIIWMITYQWYAGDVLCRITKFFHTFGFYLNSFVIACIAIDRVFGTYNLSSHKASRRAYRRCRKMLIIAWICAFIFSLPQSFVFRVFEPPGMQNFKQCTPIWTIITYEIDIRMSTTSITPEENERLLMEFNKVLNWERIYNIAHLLFVFWIPALIIVASYVTVLCLLNSFAPGQKRPTDGTPTTDAEEPWKRSLFEWCFWSASGSNKYQKSSPLGSLHLPPLPRTPSSTPRPSVADTAPQPLLVSMRADPVNGTATPSADVYVRNAGYREGLPSTRANRSISMGSFKFDLRRQSAAVQRSMGPFALQTITRARQKAKRQAALIIVAYLSFWTPYNLLAMMNTFSASEGTLKQVASVTLPFLNSLIVVNPIVNPLIYGLFDRDTQ